MTRKLFAAGILTIGAAATLFVAGCSSANGDKPFALTGGSSIAADEVNERARWTDDKGHYRPDWRYGKNTPYGYPKPAVK
jgi:hypothetical protein